MWKRNKLIIIITLALLLVAAIVLLTRKDKTYQDNFAVNDIETITKIYMSDKKNKELLLEKQDEDKWSLNKDYIARKDIMESLLITLRDMRVREPVARAALKNIVNEMAATSTKVEIYQTRYRINLFDKIKLFPHEKLTKVIYVGFETSDNMGTYMFLKGEEKPYVLHIPGFRGMLTPRFIVVEDLWRDRLLFDYSAGEIKSVEMQTRDPHESFRIDKTGKFATLTLLENNQQLTNFDTIKMIDYLSSFQNVAFEGFKNNMDKVERDTIINNVQPFCILTVTTINGDKSSIKVFEKPWEGGDIDIDDIMSHIDKDRMYALVYNDKDLVTIQNYIFDRILKPASYFKK